MHTREFPVLDEADQPLVERLAVGLGDDAARVLAYLLARERYEGGEEADPATRLAVRIGTECNRETVATALSRLGDRDLLATTTLHTSARGRPPKAWRPATGEEGTIERVDASHGERLVARAIEIAAAIGPVESTDEHRSPATDRAKGRPSEGPTETRRTGRSVSD